MSTTAALFLLAYVCTVLSRLAGWGEDMGNEGRFIVMVMEKCQGATVDPEPNPSYSRYSGQEQRGRCTHVMHSVLYCMHHAHSLFPFLTSTRRKIKGKRKKMVGHGAGLQHPQRSFSTSMRDSALLRPLGRLSRLRSVLHSPPPSCRSFCPILGTQYAPPKHG